MNKFARLSMLLPTAMGLSMAAGSVANAYQLGAAEYAAKIASALASGNVSDASAAAERLRNCGVTSIVVDGRSTPLEGIVEAGSGAFSGDNATFVIGSISSSSVDCDVPPETTTTAVEITESLLPTSGDNPSST